MADYLIAKRKEEKAAKGKKPKSKKKHKDETPEERRARKERKRLRKGKNKSAGMKGVEELLNSLGGTGGLDRRRRSASPRRSRSRTPPARERGHGQRGRERDVDDRPDHYGPARRHSKSYERSPPSRQARSRSRSATPPLRPRGTRYVDDDRKRFRRDDSMDAPTRGPGRGYD